MNAKTLILSFAILAAGCAAAQACDPKAEEDNMKALFESRAMDEGQQKQFFDRLMVDGKEIEDAINAGKIDVACEKIEGFKTFVASFPAK